MTTAEAFARGAATRGAPQRVFDWNRAATLIRERGTRDARAGLTEDWVWTAGLILREGVPVPVDDTYTYLSSSWAIPELTLDGDTLDCWVYASETDGWDASTYWPESALAILSAS